MRIINIIKGLIIKRIKELIIIKRIYYKIIIMKIIITAYISN